jgi:UDP-4-amino-4,6-dideoxy-N-acetyl-beta-L-altrosamine transaminase
MISYGKQTIDKSDIDSVIEVLKGGWLSSGPAVKTFEDDLNKYFGSKHASAVSSGTAALHLIGQALEWQSDDIVITSPLTFLATANSIVYAGATPDFVDIDPITYTIDPNKAEGKIKSYLKKGKNVRAIIGIDFAGHPCDWDALRAIADKYDLKLVNDNCHAMGASLNGDKHYAVKYADVISQSYHPVKHITTGEGGSALTNDSIIDEKIRRLRNHGMTKAQDQLVNNDGPWYYEMHELGYNYRITDIQCALGSSQLKRLDRFVQKRRKIAEKYNESFFNIDNLRIPKINNVVEHAYHLYPLQVDFKKIGLNKQEFFEKMKKAGINLQVHYIPIHLQPYYQKHYDFSLGDFPVSENYYRNEISLPIYPDLSLNEISLVVNNILRLISA